MDSLTGVAAAAPALNAEITVEETENGTRVIEGEIKKKHAERFQDVADVGELDKDKSSVPLTQAVKKSKDTPRKDGSVKTIGVSLSSELKMIIEKTVKGDVTTVSVNNDDSLQVNNVAKLAKKGRGRPKKIDTPSTNQPNAEAHMGSESNNDEPTGPTKQAVMTEKRTRGRPKKNITVKTDASSSIIMASSSNGPEDIPTTSASTSGKIETDKGNDGPSEKRKAPINDEKGANKAAKTKRTKQPDMFPLYPVYQFKITLQGIRSPTVWRRIQILKKANFINLHDAIQNGMGWRSSHMHMFNFGIDDLDEHKEESTRLMDMFQNVGSNCVYTYDLGDSWEHKVELETMMSKNPRSVYPLTVEGKGVCPPEDCGGVHGYKELLKALKKSVNERTQDENESLAYYNMDGPDFNPLKFKKQTMWGWYLDTS